jgi:hypothetical protein
VNDKPVRAWNVRNFRALEGLAKLQESFMPKIGLIAAAALVAASLPLMAAGAHAQDRPVGGGGAAGGGAAARGGGPVGGGAAIGGGMRGGGAMVGGGGAVRSVAPGPDTPGRVPGAGPSVGSGPQVGWAGRPGWSGRPGWNGHHHHHHHHRRWIGPGIGFGTGFALGAYAASPYYYGSDPYYYYDDYPYDETYVVRGTGTSANDVAYCQQRFKSYDVRSGTYLGYDGQRHPCP